MLTRKRIWKNTNTKSPKTSPKINEFFPDLSLDSIKSQGIPKLTTSTSNSSSTSVNSTMRAVLSPEEVDINDNSTHFSHNDSSDDEDDDDDDTHTDTHTDNFSITSESETSDTGKIDEHDQHHDYLKNSLFKNLPVYNAKQSLHLNILDHDDVIIDTSDLPVFTERRHFLEKDRKDKSTKSGKSSKSNKNKYGKRVTFCLKVKVVLIPTRDEFRRLGLFESLFYNAVDFMIFKQEAFDELSNFIKTNEFRIKKKAMKKLGVLKNFVDADDILKYDSLNSMRRRYQKLPRHVPLNELNDDHLTETESVNSSSDSLIISPRSNVPSNSSQLKEASVILYQPNEYFGDFNLDETNNTIWHDLKEGSLKEEVEEYDYSDDDDDDDGYDSDDTTESVNRKEKLKINQNKEDNVTDHDNDENSVWRSYEDLTSLTNNLDNQIAIIDDVIITTSTY